MNAIRVATFVLVAMALIGCRAEGRRKESSRTIIVQSARQPTSDAIYDSGDRAVDRIEVVMAQPRGEAGPSPLASLVGRSVKVQFRRDALGLAATAPVPPTGQGPGGRAVHISGTIRTVSGGWLVLERERNTYWVPQASILLIELSEGPTTSPAVEQP